MSRPGLTNERLLAAFVLGLLLFLPPFLGIFNTPRFVLGVPVLVLYCFAAWAMLIGVVALIVSASRDETSDGAETDSPERLDAAGG